MTRKPRTRKPQNIFVMYCAGCHSNISVDPDQRDCPNCGYHRLTVPMNVDPDSFTLPWICPVCDKKYGQVSLAEQCKRSHRLT